MKKPFIIIVIILFLTSTVTSLNNQKELNLSAVKQNQIAFEKNKQTNWLKKNSHIINSLTSENYDDLKFLKSILKNKRIVQLGEDGHGMKEFSLIKTRLVKFLHQQLGFDVIVFESSLYQCYQADLLAGEARPVDTLMDCAFGVWHTREVLPLFDYLKKMRNSKRPLRLAGYDIQPIGRNKKNRPAFLRDAAAKIDKKYAEEVFALDKIFLEHYAKSSSERRKIFRQEGEKLIAGYEKLAGFLQSNEKKLEKIFAKTEQPKAHLVARQTAQFLARYIRQQTAPDMKSYAERRDEGMAQNLFFILEELFPKKKIVVWGHNYHLRHNNAAIPPVADIFPGVPAKAAGSWLKEKYGERLFTVGLYAFQGKAADNSRKTYDITKARPESLEGILHSAGKDYLFVDLSNRRKSAETAWMFEPIPARFNAQQEQILIPKQQYDALLLIDSVSTPEYLY